MIDGRRNVPNDEEIHNEISKTKDDTNVFTSTKENLIRIVDEAAKIQPKYSQSISNFQHDYMQSIKSAISTTIHAQKQMADAGPSSWKGTYPKYQFTAQFVKQSNEITRNAIRAVNINNQLTINALEAARENLKIYNKTIDAMTEFNTNVAKAWSLLFVSQRQALGY